MKQKDPDSFLFGLAVGGDAAPIVGMSFLVSFVNVHKRIASSSESYMIFGGNVEETSDTVRKYINKLLSDLKNLESQVFNIDIGGNIRKVEFAVTELPNDMKMLAFLCGELSNSATYFCSFANVTSNNSTKLTYTFGSGSNNEWKPFLYSKRISDANSVQK